jgi:UDP-N-acetylmuramate dehydrogenase
LLDIQQNVSLKASNTLALDVVARYFVNVKHDTDIVQALAFADQHALPVLILGGGSNVVFTGDYSGLVIKMSLLGVEFTAQKASLRQVMVTAAAGENWHQLVKTCLANHYYGLENLSLIPGCVGAAPIQNIGAYGVELERSFVSLRGWDRQHQCWKTLRADDCQFGYRNSVFKHSLKDRFVITSVSLLLSTEPKVDVSYDALRNQLNTQALAASQITPEQVAEAVIAIRQSKLPDPAHMPNAGSFFKNPIIEAGRFDTLKQQHPDIVSYPQVDGRVKLAAGWLLQQAGWKGESQGAVGMHSAQALVLVNLGGASGAEVIALAKAIQRDIHRQFGLDLVIEPAVY